MDYDLLAVDLDGTLLNSQHRLAPPDRAALHRAHEAGLRIVLCTGRSYPETRPVLAEIGLDLDAVVTAFGAMITDVRTGRTRERVPIELPLARRVTDWFLAGGFPVLWLNDAEEAGVDGYLIDGPRRHPAVERWVRQSPCRIDSVAGHTGLGFAPLRISIIDEPEILAGVSAELRRTFGDRLRHNLLRAPMYDLTVIETFAPQVSKWQAVARLCRDWGIDPARTVAIGDDVNDVDLVRSAGLGVAMANAHPDVKRVARRVTADHDSAGVAALLEDLLGA